MSVQRESAVINEQIVLKNNFKYSQTSDYFDPLSITKVEILDSDGVTVLETITGANIIKSSTGQYYVVASAVTSAKTIYDKWTFVPVTGASALTKTNTCVVWSTVAGAGGLTTLANVRTSLGLSATQTGDDTLITNLISRISDMIEKKCGRVFSIATYTEYHDGDNTDSVQLDQYPINSVTSIHDDTDRSYGVDSLISSDDYVYYSEEGKIQLDGLTFSKGLKNIKVIYNAGFDVIPYDLEQACIKYIMAEYLEEKGGINVIEGQDFIYKPAKLREDANKVLQLYIKIR